MAGDHGQLDVLPILAGEVFDHRPALEQAARRPPPARLAGSPDRRSSTAAPQPHSPTLTLRSARPRRAEFDAPAGRLRHGRATAASARVDLRLQVGDRRKRTASVSSSTIWRRPSASEDGKAMTRDCSAIARQPRHVLGDDRHEPSAVPLRLPQRLDLSPRARRSEGPPASRDRQALKGSSRKTSRERLAAGQRDGAERRPDRRNPR